MLISKHHNNSFSNNLQGLNIWFDKLDVTALIMIHNIHTNLVDIMLYLAQYQITKSNLYNIRVNCLRNI